MGWLVNLSGIALIALIVWWFWLYRPAVLATNVAMAGAQELTILVENGVYLPERIQLPAGQPATIRFLRKDPAPCAETVVFDSLNINHELPLDQSTEINLPALSAGLYPFTCQMQMYRGELMVVASDLEPGE